VSVVPARSASGERAAVPLGAGSAIEKAAMTASTGWFELMAVYTVTVNAASRAIHPGAFIDQHRLGRN
jgi:hypothetical protein